MRRRRKKSNRPVLIAGFAVLFLAFVVHIAVDQHLLFSRYHNELADRTAQIAKLESEISEMETDLKEVDSLPFVMKYALKYGMIPTDLTPRPVELPGTETPESGEVHDKED